MAANDEELTPAAPTAFVRAEQLARLRAAERDLAQLGKINPLALEEFSALEERHRFLTEQLEDLRRTRRDLLEIVKEVDARVEEVFASAFADVAREFEVAFARLFPGGDGQLVLTEPDDLLASGIDVEARPPGKRIKRLSLLSGGERSLVAVAFLVALSFGLDRRPSTFSMKSRRHSTTRTSVGCSRSMKSSARRRSCSSSPTRSARWASPTRCTASRCEATVCRP